MMRRDMLYWLAVVGVTVLLPVGLVGLTSPDAADILAKVIRSRRILYFLSLLATGTVAGLFVGTQLGETKILQGSNAQEFTFVKRAFELAVGRIMPPLLVLTALSPLPVLVAVRGGPKPVLILVATAFVLWLLATVVTVVLNVPVNKVATSWDVNQPPPNWTQFRNVWNLGQTIRTALMLPAFAALLMAALIDDEERGSP